MISPFFPRERLLMGWARSDQTTQEVPGASDDASDSPPPASSATRDQKYSIFSSLLFPTPRGRRRRRGEKVEIRKSAGAHYHPPPPLHRKVNKTSKQTLMEKKRIRNCSFSRSPPQPKRVKWWEPHITYSLAFFFEGGKS